MFELLTAFHSMLHVQQLYGSSTIEFGAQNIGNQADTNGNRAADWNYGYASLSLHFFCWQTKQVGSVDSLSTNCVGCAILQIARVQCFLLV